MARPTQLGFIDQALKNQLASVVNLPKVAAPFNTVTKRATMTDLANDLMPRMGIDRIMVQNIAEVQGELGPNGERVYKPINDIHDQIRFVGSWFQTDDANGPQIQTSTINDYVEISYYGTGLNILNYQDTTSNVVSTLIDGAAGTSVTITGSPVLTSRKSGCNIIRNVVNNQTLGFHTVQLKLASGTGPYMIYQGFEVINGSGTSPNVIQLPAGTAYVGGKKLSKSALSVTSYDGTTAFESGTLGTKGGRVLVYQKSDGSIGRAVTPADASQLNLTSASHANEDPIRQHSFREFGAGRADDFSTIPNDGTHISRLSVLDDGTTHLSASDARIVSTATSPESFSCFSAGSFIMITFFGTGLDILRYDEGTLGSSTLDSHSVSVDGASIGSVTGTSYRGWTKIVSGLACGSHTVKISRPSNANNGIGFAGFMVYGPKKPTLPTDALELSDYHILGNYSQISSLSTVTDKDKISTGVLRKYNTREFLYTGTWTSGTDFTNFAGGLSITTSAVAATYKYTFYGTGIEIFGLFNAGAALSYNIDVDGLNLNTQATTNFVNGTTGITFSPGASSTLTGTAAAVSKYSLKIAGLTLGLHTLTVTCNVGTSALYTDAVDIITPVYSPRSNVPGDIQSGLPIGSCAMADNRKFSSQAVKTLANWAQALGLTSSPTTSSTTYVPVTDMICTVKTTGNPIEINYSVTSSNGTTPNVNVFQVSVDGVLVGIEKAATSAINAAQNTVTDKIIVPVAAGTHTVQLNWQVGGGTATAFLTRRSLNVREM